MHAPNPEFQQATSFFRGSMIIIMGPLIVAILSFFMLKCLFLLCLCILSTRARSSMQSFEKFLFREKIRCSSLRPCFIVDIATVLLKSQTSNMAILKCAMQSLNNSSSACSIEKRLLLFLNYSLWLLKCSMNCLLSHSKEQMILARGWRTRPSCSS